MLLVSLSLVLLKQIYNDHTVHYIAPPYLLKSVLNNLANHTFIFNDKRASWGVIEQCYEKDKQLSLSYAPKLTHSHIHLNDFSKMKVRLAAQVLSHSVSAAINAYIAMNELPAEDSKTLPPFLLLFDMLWDACNTLNIVN